MIEIAKISLEAWKQLDRAVFQAAWVICGYTTVEELSVYDGQLAAVGMDAEVAQQTLSDLFSKYGKHFTPQLCTAMEWQVKATVADGGKGKGGGGGGGGGA